MVQGSWFIGKRSRNAEIRNWKFGLHVFVLLMNDQFPSISNFQFSAAADPPVARQILNGC